MPYSHWNYRLQFEKPGRRTGWDYQDFALEAGTKALIDANLKFDDVEFAAVGLVPVRTCFFTPMSHIGLGSASATATETLLAVSVPSTSLE
jgi:hypothetical protein